jgi:3-dehydroquinate synthase
LLLIGAFPMQESFEVKTSSGQYRVTSGRGLFQKARLEHPDAIYLVDAKLLPGLNLDGHKVISLPALESSKSLDKFSEIIVQLREFKANRDTHLFAVGGGVIQDIVTFAASIYMRGIAWTYFPTTLVSMADSCIGGKSSINVAGHKNLVGNIYPPSEVQVDLDFCLTLSAEEIVGGLAEAVKICYARGDEYFRKFLALNPAYPMSPDEGTRIVACALSAKKWIIEVDEFDCNERLLLNFGHTFGHALEAGSNFAIPHGVAVGMGVLVACNYARTANALTELGTKCSADLQRYMEQLLEPVRHSIVAALASIDFDAVMQKFESDKKHRADFYRMVIPVEDGGLKLISEPKNAATKMAIHSAYLNTFRALGYI